MVVAVLSFALGIGGNTAIFAREQPAAALATGQGE
jgi:hypothetical protein